MPKQYSVTIGAAIFGFLVIVSGLLSIALPETTGHNMPETVEEANILSQVSAIYPRIVNISALQDITLQEHFRLIDNFAKLIIYCL